LDYKNVKLLIYVRFLFKKTCKTNINVLFLKDFNIYENIFYLNILLNCILIEIYNYLKMNFKLNITNISSIEEIKNYWSNADYVNLLGKFDFPDAQSIKSENLQEMLFMAIQDFEPNEAANIVLTYKLSEVLNEGQIDQVSNDMLLDKVSEEYPDISLHSTLYSINQLLFKAYNGKFLNTKASKWSIDIVPVSETDLEMNKEIALKLLTVGLTERSLNKRLFAEQLASNGIFEEANGIVWYLNNKGGNSYELITSEYWLDREGIANPEFEAEYIVSEE